MSQQPKWKYVASFGDVNPLNHEGALLFVDETGVYPSELEVITIDNNGEVYEENLKYTIYRVPCEPCFFDEITGVLSDNKFHKDYPVWWAKADPDHKQRHGYDQWSRFRELAEGMDMTANEYARQFTSDDPEVRGQAYYWLGEHHGWNEFDQYPLKMNRAEAEKRYNEKRAA